MKPQNVKLDQYITAAVNPEDKLVYIKALNGNLAKMDPKSKEAELVTTGLDAGWTYDAICCFDSLDPDVLYIYTSLSSGLTAADIYWSNVTFCGFTYFLAHCVSGSNCTKLPPCTQSGKKNLSN